MRALTAHGAHVAIVDRAEFPRVKLCAGWLSPAIWDALELSPSSYPRGLWEWHTCHVHYRGADHEVPCHGWFIRRYELDDYLLSLSGADPLNLLGTIVPGPKVPAVTNNRVLYRDGIPAAALAAGEVLFFADLDAATEWQARKALVGAAVFTPSISPAADNHPGLDEAVVESVPRGSVGRISKEAR